MGLIIRIVIVYVVLIAGLRLLGKRELSQLTPFELLMLMLVPEMLQQAMMGEDFSLTSGLVAVTTLFGLVYLNSFLSYKFRLVRAATEGSPTILVRYGKLVPDGLGRERVPADEVYSEMHHAGIERLEQVKWAILETDGQISFIPFEPVKPLLREPEPNSPS